MKKANLLLLLFCCFLASCDLGDPIYPSGSADYFPLEVGKSWQYQYDYRRETTLDYRFRSGIMTWKVLDSHPETSSQGQTETVYSLEETMEAREHLLRKDNVNAVNPDSTIKWTRPIEMRVSQGQLKLHIGEDTFGAFPILLTDQAPLQVKYGTVFIPSGEMTFERNTGMVLWQMRLVDPYEDSWMRAMLIR